MLKAGRDSIAWMALACVLSSCGARQLASKPHLPPVAAVKPTPDPAPALTLPPPVVPDVIVTLDLRRLFESVTRGTNVTLDASSLSQLFPFTGALMDQPVVVGSDAATSPSPLVVLRAESAVTYRPGASDVALAARGLLPLEGGNCALARNSAVGALLFCGTREKILTYGEALLPRVGSLQDGRLIEVDARLSVSSWKDDVYDLRAAVPRNVARLLPKSSGLEQNVPLRLALMDAAFELASRLAEGYEGLGRVRATLSMQQDGNARFGIAVTPSAGTVGERAITGARSLTAPGALWELSDKTESALVFDTSLLGPLLAPSRRTLALLAEARDASSAPDRLVDNVTSLFMACTEPSRSVVQAYGTLPDAKRTTKEAEKVPGLPARLADGPERVRSFTLLAIDDPNSSCGEALRSLFGEYERRAATPGLADAEQDFRSLVPPKPLSKVVKLLRFGPEKSGHYLGIASRRGTLWLASAAELATLNAALIDLLAPPPKRRSLRDRAELADFGKEPALVSGFVGEDVLPVSAALGLSKASRLQKLLPQPQADAGVRRVPFALRRHENGFQLSGSIEGKLVRSRVAELLAEAWSDVDLAALNTTQQGAALKVLDASCRLGQGRACNALGIRFGDGRGIPKDVERASEYLVLGCEQSTGIACANLPFYKSAGPADDLRLFRKACELEAAFGCAWYGVRLQDSGNPAEQVKAREKLQEGCDGFVGFACARLGYGYLEGNGVAKDATKGADYQQRACELSFGQGCVAVGDAYSSGEGRPQDKSRAFGHYKLACKLDPAAGCYALGFAYLEGVGTPKDTVAARAQLNIACDAEHADACRQLAEMADDP